MGSLASTSILLINEKTRLGWVGWGGGGGGGGLSNGIDDRITTCNVVTGFLQGPSTRETPPLTPSTKTFCWALSETQSTEASHWGNQYYKTPCRHLNIRGMQTLGYECVECKSVSGSLNYVREKRCRLSRLTRDGNGFGV